MSVIAARDELIAATLEVLPEAERPSLWALGRAWTAIAQGATQDAVELAHLLDVLRPERPRVVVEVGTQFGGSLWAWAQIASDDAVLVSVDQARGHEEFLNARCRRAPGQRIVQVTGDSQTTQIRDTAAEYGAVDFLFIDADHRLAGVTRDYELYSPLVRPGGIIAFHDIVPVPPDPIPENVIEVAQLWELIRPVDAWEWSYAGDRFGIGAYQTSLEATKA